jgi:hypothetical protein
MFTQNLRSFNFQLIQLTDLFNHETSPNYIQSNSLLPNQKVAPSLKSNFHSSRSGSSKNLKLQQFTKISTSDGVTTYLEESTPNPLVLCKSTKL